MRKNDVSDIAKRKKDHLRIALSPKAQKGFSGFSEYRFEHNALPEIDFDKIDTKTSFLSKKVNYPFFISCMTGGAGKGGIINRNLAVAAEKCNFPLGVGSQRAAIQNPELQKTFEVRKYAPSIPIMANIGLVQLNYGYGYKELEKAVNMVSADALVVHINPIQEVIQPEGDRNFENLIPKLAKIIKKLKVPVIAKEVGFGLSENVAKRLYDVGVRIFDTAGWGGTNWAYIEGRRRVGREDLGETFSDWGIPTTESIKSLKHFKDSKKDKYINILGSGGVRSGIDIAKAISLGSDMVGIATPFAEAALISSEKVEDIIQRHVLELKISMFGVGAKDVKGLKKVKLIRKEVGMQ